MRGRILRVRPGHLSNFSGGAGYSPCIVLLAGPIAFILSMIASITLYLASRQGRLTYYSDADGYQPPADGVLDYASPAPTGAWMIARRYLITWIVLAIVGITSAVILALQAMGNVYSTDAKYLFGAWGYAASPFLAVVATFWFQYFLSRRWGGRWWHLIISPVLFIVLTFLLLLITGFLFD